MVKIGLQVKANLENIASFAPEGDDFVWRLKLKCMSCGEETANWQTLELDESRDIKGSRGKANLVIKCKLCSRENSIDIIPETLSAYTDDGSSKFKTIVVFDCRGVEPTDFQAGEGFVAEATETRAKFNDVNLLEKEWVDYDEKGNQTVGIYELEHQFIKIK